jgi:hypothetical protein
MIAWTILFQDSDLTFNRLHALRGKGFNSGTACILYMFDFFFVLYQSKSQIKLSCHYHALSFKMVFTTEHNTFIIKPYLQCRLFTTN